jgi:hypothetical protein
MGNIVVLALLTLLGGGVVLRPIWPGRPAVAGAIAAGIALASEPSQVSQQIA